MFGLWLIVTFLSLLITGPGFPKVVGIKLYKIVQSMARWTRVSWNYFRCATKPFNTLERKTVLFSTLWCALWCAGKRYIIIVYCKLNKVEKRWINQFLIFPLDRLLLIDNYSPIFPTSYLLCNMFPIVEVFPIRTNSHTEISLFPFSNKYFNLKKRKMKKNLIFILTDRSACEWNQPSETSLDLKFFFRNDFLNYISVLFANINGSP